MASISKVESAHQQISSMLILNEGSVLETPHGLVARWVVLDSLLYLEAILNYGNWRVATNLVPKPEVKTFCRRYGVSL